MKIEYDPEADALYIQIREDDNRPVNPTPGWRGGTGGKGDGDDAGWLSG